MDIEKVLGIGEIFHYELYFRGIIITLYAIVLFRTNSSRLFGNQSPLDFIIYIVLGAILGEAIVNHIPVIPSMIVCALIVALYRFLAYLSYKSHTIGKYIKGDKVWIIRDGKYIQKNLRSCQVTPHDIERAFRVQYGRENIHQVKKAILERDGQISFIMN